NNVQSTVVWPILRWFFPLTNYLDPHLLSASASYSTVNTRRRKCRPSKVKRSAGVFSSQELHDIISRRVHGYAGRVENIRGASKRCWFQNLRCPMGELQSALLLKKQLAELRRVPVDGFSAGLQDDDIYKWEVLVIGPPDTLYEGGFFKAILDFPKEYPQHPPKMRFISDIWHPNIDKEGNVCISILHEPGDDRWGYEKPEERWLPVHTVETILLSVISMLADPNHDSPANVDAAKMQRENFAEFKKRVAACVRKSQEEC
uniref:E2 ubiquitin-conjugating enzyme n=2 Tax=Parascaris univalens TaxID=6257 RepID=A0A915C2R3_PARUN